MKEVITYCVEYRRDEDSFYHPSFHGFQDKDTALKVAEKASSTLHARVVEQRRKVVKTFSANQSLELTAKNRCNSA